MQLLDELSMIYTTCVLFFVVFSYRQSKYRKILLLLCIITLAIFITGYYYYIKDPLFHQNMFALLTIVVVFWSMYVMDKTLRPYSIGSWSAED
jgi:dihydroceramidase